MSQTLTTIELDAISTSPELGNSEFCQTFTPPYPAMTSTPSAQSSYIDGSNTPILPRGRAIIVIVVLAGIEVLNSLSNGLLNVALPRMAVDLELPDHLMFWPTAACYLTCGSTLLLAGSLADALGSRRFFLAGCFLVGIFTLACGFTRTGLELIMFRAMQGIATALCLPTSISIMSKRVSAGRTRNIGLSCLGIGQVLGFSIGLVLGGVFVDTIGWRFAYYLCGVAAMILFLLGIWALPADRTTGASTFQRLTQEIDWIGAAIASTSLATFSYVLATISSNVSYLRHVSNILLLTISLALVPAFGLWVHRQEKHHKPALIPNTLWKNTAFTSICLTILFSYAVVDSMELLSSLFFQKVQDLSAIQTSLRLLPDMLLGLVLNISTGLFVHRIPAVYLVLVSSALSAGAPLLMALINPRWPYWFDAFFAQLLVPLSVDVLFTVGILLVSQTFPDNTQALAGAVFSTVAQMGTAIGLAVISVISTSATKNSKFPKKSSPEALLAGYRASFWAAFAWMMLTCVVGGLGLRKVGRIGLKRD